MKRTKYSAAAAAGLAGWLVAAAPAWAGPSLQAVYQGSALQLTLPGHYLSFSVFRGTGPEGPWHPLLLDNTDCLGGCGYQDLQVDPGATYYYRLDATDTGHVSGSYVTAVR